MSESTLVAVVYGATSLAAVASFVLILLARRSRLNSRAVWRTLVWAAVAGALLAGAAIFWPAAEDSGAGFAIAVTGAPVVIATAPIVAATVTATRPGGTAARIVSWVAAALMLAFVIFFLPSLGIFYLPAALLMVAAASTPPLPRRA